MLGKKWSDQCFRAKDLVGLEVLSRSKPPKQNSPGTGRTVLVSDWLHEFINLCKIFAKCPFLLKFYFDFF